MTSSTPPVPEKLPVEKQQRLHTLLDKNSEGTITAAERAELGVLVEESEKLMVSNARHLAEFLRSPPNAPTGAVPVTVWIKPNHAES